MKEGTLSMKAASEVIYEFVGWPVEACEIQTASSHVLTIMQHLLEKYNYTLVVNRNGASFRAFGATNPCAMGESQDIPTAIALAMYELVVHIKESSYDR